MIETKEFNWKAFEEGRAKCEEVDNDNSRVKNPYPEGTIKWKSWNRGWSTYFSKEWE